MSRCVKFIVLIKNRIFLHPYRKSLLVHIITSVFEVRISEDHLQFCTKVKKGGYFQDALINGLIPNLLCYLVSHHWQSISNFVCL